ncbi:MAG: S-layer homology domain-containing protein [Clostridiales bacterium]|nr:S-layer homology domain-containing protein [Clostridiales bacterium]
MKRHFMAGVAVTIAAIAFPGIISLADSEVKIDETNFPDEIFRQYVADNLDKDSNGSLDDDEMKCHYIKVSGLEIKSLKGIEYFPELRTLMCYKNSLSELDISNNHKIESLDCSFNNIKKLDISSAKGLSKAFGENTQYYDADGNLNDENPVYVSYQYYDADDQEEESYTLVVDVDVDIINNPVKMSVDSNFPVVGKPLQLKVKQGEKDVTKSCKWIVSDKSMASVDDNGILTAKKAGHFIVTCEYNNAQDSVNLFALYKDVSSSKDFWYEPTNVLTRMGVVKGYKDQSEFRPANKCTRAQMVTFIWRLVGEPEPDSKTCKFSDVKESDYFYKACIWGNENHIVEGYKDGTFGPQITCARKHAVTFLWRLAGKPEPETKTCKFSDVKEKDYYYIPVIWANENHILEGYKDGTFRADNDCLRRQMVTFLWRYYLDDYYKNDNPDFLVDKYLLYGQKR